MKSPTTYAEWCDYLDRLSNGSLQVTDLPLLDSGEIEWSRGTAERYIKRFAEAYDKVLKQCADRLQKNLSNISHPHNNEYEIVKALSVTRRTLELLFQVSLIKPIPEDLKNYLQETVNNYAQQTQSSLEQSSKIDKSGSLTYVLKNNSLLNFNKQAWVRETGSSSEENFVSKNNLKPQRRIML